MRTTVHLQERHLAEAVRRKVITEEQFEGVLAVARSMTPADGAAPDLRWITAVHGMAAFAAVVIPGAWLLGNTRHLAAWETMALSALMAVGAWIVGTIIRRAGLGRVPAAVFTMGAAAFTWGVGAAACVLATRGLEAPFDAGYALPDRQMRECQAWLAGDALMILAAVVLGRLHRVPATAAVAALGFVHLGMTAGDLNAALHHSYFSSRSAAPWLMVLGVALLATGRLMDRLVRGRNDPAFWLHLVGLAPLGLGAFMRIDREPAEAVIWSFVALVVAVLGVRWNRRAYLVAAAGALTIYPTAALLAGHNDATVVFAVLGVILTLIAAASAWLRRYYTRAWIERPEHAQDRTVWG